MREPELCEPNIIILDNKLFTKFWFIDSQFFYDNFFLFTFLPSSHFSHEPVNHGLHNGQAPNFQPLNEYY